MTSDFHFLLMRCFNYSSREIVHRTSALGLLPGQPKILECLIEKDNCLPRDLGLHCGIDKSTMSSLLNKMEKQGLIRRHPDPDDRRSVRVLLTDEGRAIAEKVRKMTEDIDRFALQNLTEEEKNSLQESLQTVLKTFMKGESRDESLD
ncbi:MAG: MarR family winged helix-turn-helix transcriptional regulator [Eubacterium sp.]